MATRTNQERRSHANSDRPAAAGLSGRAGTKAAKAKSATARQADLAKNLTRISCSNSMKICC